MSDLPKQLRNDVHRHCRNETPCGFCVTRYEAADRIEELEAALRELDLHADVIATVLPTSAEMLKETIRRALGGSDE